MDRSSLGHPRPANPESSTSTPGPLCPVNRYERKHIDVSRKVKYVRLIGSQQRPCGTEAAGVECAPRDEPRLLGTAVRLSRILRREYSPFRKRPSEPWLRVFALIPSRRYRTGGPDWLLVLGDGIRIGTRPRWRGVWATAAHERSLFASQNVIPKSNVIGSQITLCKKCCARGLAGFSWECFEVSRLVRSIVRLSDWQSGQACVGGGARRVDERCC